MSPAFFREKVLFYRELNLVSTPTGAVASARGISHHAGVWIFPVAGFRGLGSRDTTSSKFGLQTKWAAAIKDVLKDGHCIVRIISVSV